MEPFNIISHIAPDIISSIILQFLPLEQVENNINKVNKLLNKAVNSNGNRNRRNVLHINHDSNLSHTSLLYMLEKYNKLEYIYIHIPIIPVISAVLKCNFPNIKHLVVPKLIFNDRSLIKLSACSSHLQCLLIHYDSNITDKGLIFLSTQCPELSHLVIPSYNLTDKSIICLSKNCPKLQHLDMSDSSQFIVQGIHISDESIIALAENCPKLETLHLYTCNISDIGLEALANGCPLLEALNIKYCRMVTDAGLMHLARLQNLKLLICSWDTNDTYNTLQWQMKVTKKGRTDLQKLIPGLIIHPKYL